MNENVEMDEWSLAYEWLGIIYPQDRRNSASLITPLAYDDAGWCVLTEDERKAYFPNNGKVVYHHPNDNPALELNQLYQFKIRYSYTFDEENRSSSYYSSDTTTFPKHLAPLFDWSSRASHIFDLVACLQQGVPAKDYLFRTIYIGYQDLFYGPIQFIPSRSDPLLLQPQVYLDGSNTGGSPLVLDGYSVYKDDIIKFDGQQFIDDRLVESPVTRVDLSLPQVVIKNVLEASNRLSTRDDERLVKKRVKELAALNSSTGLQVEPSTIQRAEYIIDHQLENFDSLQELIGKLPIEHPLLVAARVWEIEQRKGQIEQEASTKRQELAQQFEKEERDLQVLQEHVRFAESELKTVQEKLVEETHKIEKMKRDYIQVQSELEEFTRSLDERLVQLREKPLRFLADLQLTMALPKAFFQPLSDTAALKVPETSIVLDTAPHHFFSENAVTLTNLSTLPLQRVSQQYEVGLTSVRRSVAALLAGLIPVVDCPEDLFVLQAIAHAIVGQRLWSVPLSLTALSPLDLFGSIVNEQRMFVPVGDLADIVIEAQAHPDQLGIILLEGMDRVPFHPVIAPLLQQYRAVREHVRRGDPMHSAPAPLRLFHPRSLVSDDPYQPLSRLNWPTNLFLAVTVDHGVGSFSLPETYTSWFMSIEALKQKLYTPKEQTSNTTDCWQVSPEQWYDSEKESFCRGLSDQSLPTGLLLWQRVFCVAMQKTGITGKKLEDLVEQLRPQ